MQDTHTEQEISLDYLEELFNHEAQCQSPHRNWAGNLKCTKTPVARYIARCNGTNKLVCLNFALAFSGLNLNWPCAGCGVPTKDCWSLIPL